MKAIIIGAGIAGLATAIGLTRRGVEFELYERAEQLTEVGAGISLWANALYALDHLGVAEIHQISQPLRQTELRLNQGRKRTSLFEAELLSKLLDYSPPLVMVHRAELIDALAGHVEQSRLHFAHELIEVEQTASTVTATFKNGRQVTGDLLIASDGIKSIVRESIQGKAVPRYSGYTCYRGVSPRPRLIEPGYMGEWWGRGQRFGITTLPHDRIYWFATRNAPQSQALPQVAQTVRRLFVDWAEPIPEILETTPDDHFLHNDIIDRPPNPLQCQGRIVLIGDAAHPTTPNLGQGGCMAIEDACELSACLAEASNEKIPVLLSRFVQHRFPRTKAIVNQSHRLGAMAQWESSLACVVRDQLVNVIANLLGPKEMVKFAKYRSDKKIN